MIDSWRELIDSQDWGPTGWTFTQAPGSGPSTVLWGHRDDQASDHVVPCLRQTALGPLQKSRGEGAVHLEAGEGYCRRHVPSG